MKKSNDHYIVAVRCCAALCLFVGVVCVSANVVRVTHDDVRKVAVLEFRNLAGLTDSEVAHLAESVRDIAVKTLSEATFVVMTREKIADLIPANMTPISWALSENMIGVGRLLGADYIISGEVLKYDDGYRARLRVHQCRTSLFLGSSTARGETLFSVEEDITNAAASIFTLMETREPLVSRAQTRAGGRGRGTQRHDDTNGDSPRVVEKPAGSSGQIKMVLIPIGEFVQGSNHHNDHAKCDDEVPHRAKMSRPLYLSDTEITQAVWKSVVDTNPSFFVSDELPVERVTWLDAIRFCNELSKRDGLEPAYDVETNRVVWKQGSNGYRLPTESEWEYACRGGTDTPFNTGSCLTTSEANFDGRHSLAECPEGTSSEGTSVARSFPPNAWGLFEMHGNVAEWCWDPCVGYEDSEDGPPNVVALGHPQHRHVVRGGGFLSWGKDCRSASRRQVIRGHASRDVGFRVAKPAD